MKQVTSAFPLLGHAWRPVSATGNQRRRLRGHRPPHDFDDEEIRDISPSNRILTPITIK